MKKITAWVKSGLIAFVLAAIAVVVIRSVSGGAVGICPRSMYHCPGVGCVSGKDKCFPGSTGGASTTFSKEPFVSKKCPDGTRSDGPCLMEFPGL